MVLNTQVNPWEESDVLEKVSESWKIVLYNDDFNTFDHVIECLMAYCDHLPEQAEQCAWITHTKGKCEVKEGSYDDLKARCEALSERGLSAEVC